MQLCEREVAQVLKARNTRLPDGKCIIACTTDKMADLTGYIAKITTHAEDEFVAGHSRADAQLKATEYAKSVLGFDLSDITVV